LIESTLREMRANPIDPGVSAELHSVLLSVYFERGDVTKAERVAQQALAAVTQGVSPETRANVLWSASRVLAESKRWDDALDLARQARSIIEGLDDRIRLAHIHTAYAYLCLEVDPPRVGEAGRYLERADELLGPDAPTRERAYILAEQGRVALLSARPRDALTLSIRALELVGDDSLERSRIFHLRGRALDELGHHDDARDDLLEAASAFEKAGARQQAASCYRDVGEIELRFGALESALDAYRTGLEILEPRRSRA
jgi:tetratricopeptide (TPR) repeat protein